MKKILFLVLFATFSLTITSCGSQKKLVSKTAVSTVKDGSSVENAIVVNSIPEEYQYVKKVCIGCTLQGQALIFKGKKPYDVLKLKKADGTLVSYFFDISSFY